MKISYKNKKVDYTKIPSPRGIHHSGASPIIYSGSVFGDAMRTIVRDKPGKYRKVDYTKIPNAKPLRLDGGGFRGIWSRPKKPTTKYTSDSSRTIVCCPICRLREFPTESYSYNRQSAAAKASVAQAFRLAWTHLKRDH